MPPGLHDYYIDSEDVEHSDGPPIPVPESCNTAVPDPANNFNLMQDCIVLLEDVDGLRGTGALNWSVDTAIGSWERRHGRGDASAGDETGAGEQVSDGQHSGRRWQSWTSRRSSWRATA